MATNLVLQRAEKSAALASEYKAKIREQKKRAEQKKQAKAERLATLKQEALKKKKALAREKQLQKLRRLKILDMLLASACDGRRSEEISNLSVEDLRFLKSINANIKLSFKRQMTNSEYKKWQKTLQSDLHKINSEVSWFRQSGITLENEGRYTPQVWQSRYPGVPNPFANYPPEEAWWRCHNALRSNPPPAGVTLNLLNLLHKEMNSNDDYSLKLEKLRALQKKREGLSLSIKRLSSNFYFKYKDEINSVHTVTFSSLSNTEQVEKLGVYDPTWITWIGKYYRGKQFIRFLTDRITAEVKKGRRLLLVRAFQPELSSRKKYKTILYRIGRSRGEIEGPPLVILQSICQLYGYQISIDKNAPESLRISW